MLATKTIDKLKKLGFDPTKFVDAVKADTDVEVDVPELLTEAELAERDLNTKKEGDAEGFARGKATGIEIAGKAIVKKFNLTDVDAKDVDKVAEALTKSVAKGDSGLQEQITLLQQDKERLNNEKTVAEQKAAAVQNDFGIIKHFPANRSGLADEEYLAIVKMNMEFEKGENGTVTVKRDGKVLTNETTRAPLSEKEAIAAFFTEKKFTSDGGQGGGGRGGNDGGQGGGASGIKTYRDAIAQYQKENPGKGAISQEATEYVNAIAKATTDFDYNTV